MILERRHFTPKTRLAALAVAAVILAGIAVSSRPASESIDEAYKRQIDDWHQKRIARLLTEDGYLALAGLFPLDVGANRFGSAENNQLVFPAKAPAHAGTIYRKNGKLELAAMPDAGIRANGEAVGKMEIVSDAGGKPTEFEMGTFQFYVIERAGELYLRVIDRENERLKTFKGIERFPVDAKWRVEARFEKYDPPKPIKVPNVLGYDFEEQCPGVVLFDVAGRTYRLEPMSTDGDEFFIVFGDGTSGLETYGGGRFLYARVPDEDGKMVLDFNMSYNPPCAFTPFATCPLPHEDNIIDVRIEAGEKAYSEDHP